MRRFVFVAACAALCLCAQSGASNARPRAGGSGGECGTRHAVVCKAGEFRHARAAKRRAHRWKHAVRRRDDAQRPPVDTMPTAFTAFDDSGRWPALVTPEPSSSGMARIVSAVASIDQHLRDLVNAAANAAGVPTNLAHAVIRAESNYRPRAVSSAKALGMGQIKCQTARSVGFTGPCSALFDPESNLRFSMIYLRQALDRGGHGCAGLSLYQRGIAARPVCTSYGRRVAALAAR